jgi:hypothetical protein
MTDCFSKSRTPSSARWLSLFGGALLSSSCTLSVLDDLGAGSTDAGIDAAAPSEGKRDSGAEGMDSSMGIEGSDASVADAGAPDSGSGHEVDAGCHPDVPTTFKRVFVSSEVLSGPLGSLDDMDAKCQLLADAQCLGGTWKVWLSDDNASPATRMTKANKVPYKRIDGQTVADNWSDLTDGDLKVSIGITELGAPVSGFVWTSTTTSGYSFVSLTCDNWHSALPTFSAKTGNCGTATSSWTHQDDAPCSGEARIYCFEQ